MPDSQITEVIPVPPPEKRPPGRPRNAPRVSADANREYVAAGGWSPFLADYYRSLPKYIDGIERTVGADVYERMLEDPQIFSDISILKQAVIGQKIELSPSVDEEDPRYEQAQEYLDFCERCLARLHEFRTATLYELLDGIAFGHRLAEQVYEVAGSGPDAGKLVPKAIKLKSRDSYAFVVDPYMNWVGVLGVVPGLYYQMLQGVLAMRGEDLGKLPNLLPRGKFVLFSILGKNGDPRGSAWIRAAYNSWWLKTQVWPEFYKFLLQFASPSVIGTTAPDAQARPKLDENGDPILDETDTPVIVDPVQDMLASLLTFHNSTALAIPNGAEVKTLFAFTTGDAFRLAIDLFNHEINQGILFQSLATQEAQFGSRAASQVHQDILELPIQYLRTRAEEMIRLDMFANWLRLNYGEEAVDLAPYPNLGDTEQQNFAVKASSVASLMRSGYFDPGQLRDMDQELGVPVRSAEDVARRQKQADIAAMPQEEPAAAANAGGTVQGVGQNEKAAAASNGSGGINAGA